MLTVLSKVGFSACSEERKKSNFPFLFTYFVPRRQGNQSCCSHLGALTRGRRHPKVAGRRSGKSLRAWSFCFSTELTISDKDSLWIYHSQLNVIKSTLWRKPLLLKSWATCWCWWWLTRPLCLRNFCGADPVLWAIRGWPNLISLVKIFMGFYLWETETYRNKINYPRSHIK